MQYGLYGSNVIICQSEIITNIERHYWNNLILGG